MPFEFKLVRPLFGSLACHVHYVPTRPGFRASPEDSQITELIGSIEPNGFLSGRASVGDSFDILKTVIPHLPRPVPITVYVTDAYDRSNWEPAGQTHFPSAVGRMRFIPAIGEQTHPWTQDQIKSGVADGEVKALVPRMLYEGRAEDGVTFSPLLDSLSSARTIRSKISWEGGDLLFVLSPVDPSKLIMLHGGSAERYWGCELTAKEYSYVLRVEFGADQVVDFSRAGPHVDYLTAFLPADRIALVAREERNNYSIAEAAAQELAKLYGKRAPTELRQLAGALRDAQMSNSPDVEGIQHLVAVLREKTARIVPEIDIELSAMIDRYVETHCPGEEESCFEGEGKRTMLIQAPELLRRSSDAAFTFEFEANVPAALLALIEGQLPGAPDSMAALLDAKAAEISRLGFRVVRVPYLAAHNLWQKWTGVSYLNSLVFDNTLFVPTMGLGKAEEKILASLRKKIGTGYKVIPVPARFAILRNGGVHCVTGAFRGSQPVRPPIRLSRKAKPGRLPSSLTPAPSGGVFRFSAPGPKSLMGQAG